MAESEATDRLSTDLMEQQVANETWSPLKVSLGWPGAFSRR